jgi:hypothetical protein
VRDDNPLLLPDPSGVHHNNSADSVGIQTDEVGMTEVLLVYVSGVAVGYLIWAPETKFKRAVIDGMTLSFLWRKR